MWILLALACAFLTGTGDALAKQLLGKSDERIVGWGKLFFSLPWLFLILLVTGWPQLKWIFWGIVALLLPMELTAYLCALRSIRIAPLSLAMPFQAFTPLLTVLTAWFLLKERVAVVGFLGVAAVTVGAYVLQVELVSQGIFEPFKAMFKVPGIRFMLIAGALYGITATLGKRAISLSSATSFPFIYAVVNTVALTEITRRASYPAGGFLRTIKSDFFLYLIAGLLSAGTYLTHCIGIQLAPVSYFIALKRLSLLVSVLYGGLLFRESAFLQRIVGTGFMLVGAVLIALTPVHR